MATLYYQTTSKEYVEFLRDENHTNAAGQTLYDAWSANGKSAPVAMSTRTVNLNMTSVPESVEGAPAPALSIRAGRATTDGRLVALVSLPRIAKGRLDLLDIQGRNVWSGEIGPLGPGYHEVAVDPGRRLASGIYLLRLAQGTRTASAKLVLAR